LNLLKERCAQSLQSDIEHIDEALNRIRKLAAALTYKNLENLRTELEDITNAITEFNGPAAGILETSGKFDVLKDLVSQSHGS